MKTRFPHMARLEAPACSGPPRGGMAPLLAGILAVALMLSAPAAVAADSKAASARPASAKTASARSGPAASAKTAGANAPADPAVASEAAAKPAEIPQSVFLLSSPTQTLKDPFFPNSTRLSAALAGKTPGQKKDAPAAELALKALFGTPSRPFATINSTTLGVGEEQEVITSGGRVRVRCLQINLAAQSVVIEVGGSRRELRFGTPK